MLTLAQRAAVVLWRAWTLLPAVKYQARIDAIRLEDLGAHHGCFDPATYTLTLSERLLWGSNADQLMTIDHEGSCPARVAPCATRALHTMVHELWHAVGYSTGADTEAAWLALGGWEKTAEDLQTTGRYQERRPGWGTYDSDWRYARGTWFPREYASASPYEWFADCATHLTLGWAVATTAPAAQPVLQYLRARCWGDEAAWHRQVQQARIRALFRTLGGG